MEKQTVRPTALLKFTSEVLGQPDWRGDRPFFPRGFVGPVEIEFALYAAAMGYATPVGEWSAENRAALEACRSLVALFRAEGIQPTQTELTQAMANLAALAADEATTAAATGLRP